MYLRLLSRIVLMSCPRLKQIMPVNSSSVLGQGFILAQAGLELEDDLGLLIFCHSS